MNILEKIVNEDIYIDGIRNLKALYEVNPFKLLNYCSSRDAALEIENQFGIDIQCFLPYKWGFEMDVDGVKYTDGLITGIFLEYKHCYWKDLFQINPFSWEGETWEDETEDSHIINANNVQKVVSQILKGSDCSVQSLVDNFSCKSDFMFPANTNFHGLTKFDFLKNRKGKGATWLIVYPVNLKSFSVINFTMSRRVQRWANRIQKAKFDVSKEKHWEITVELKNYLEKIGQVARPCFTQFMYNLLTLYRLGESDKLIVYILKGEVEGWIDLRNAQDKEFMKALKKELASSSGKKDWEITNNRGRFTTSMVGLFELMLELISDKIMYDKPDLYSEFADSLEKGTFDWVAFLGRIRKERKGNNYHPMDIIEDHLKSVQF